MKWNTLLFDWDSTLCHSKDAANQATDNLIATYDLEHASAKLEDLFHTYGPYASAQVWQTVLPNDHRHAEYSKHWDKGFTSLLNTDLVYLYDGALELMQRLNQAHIPFAIVTNSTREYFDIHSKRFDLKSLIPVVITADDAPLKPDPTMVLNAIEQLNGHTKSSVLIGDSQNDLLAAEQAGIDAIHILHGNEPHPSYDVVSNIQALENKLFA